MYIIKYCFYGFIDIFSNIGVPRFFIYGNSKYEQKQPTAKRYNIKLKSNAC